MRIFVIGALVLLALIVLVAGIRNKGRISWLAIVVLLVPAGALTWFEIRWQDEVKYMSTSIVQNISGNSKAQLECQRLTFAFTDVWASEKLFDTAEDTIGLKYGGCSQLLNYYRDTSEVKPAPTLEQVKVMQLVSTESVRLAGKEKDETRLTCLGVRNLPLVVQALGGTNQQGVQAAFLYQKEVLDKDPKTRDLQCITG